jgi:hypothetical protein
MKDITELISPLPWRVSGELTIRSGDNGWVGKTEYCSRCNGPENASYIVHAANMYPGMLEVLIQFEMYYPHGVNPYLDVAVNKGRAILAKCKAVS